MSTSHLAAKAPRTTKRNGRLRTIDGVDERQCYRCETWKPLGQYSARKKVGPKGAKITTQAACKECHKVIMNRYARVRRERK